MRRTRMSARDQFYSKEATLKNNAKRELADGRDKDPLDKLRLQCYARGAVGILGVARHFRNMDKDESDILDLEEMKRGFQETGIELTDDETEKLFSRFDTENNGTISTTEFLLKLRPPMSKARLTIIDKAFEKIDKNGDGIITLEDIKNIYNVKDHPKFLSGELTKKEVLSQFLNNFGGANGDMDTTVSKEEFINYYATVSASIEQDAYFDLIVRRSYKL